VRAVILAQGIQFLETIPWKTIVVPAVVLGFIVTIVDVIYRISQSRELIKLLRDIRDIAGHMYGDLSEIKDAAWDINETTLSNSGVQPLPRSKE
jgi:hypothetical protein